MWHVGICRGERGPARLACFVKPCFAAGSSVGHAACPLVRHATHESGPRSPCLSEARTTMAHHRRRCQSFFGDVGTLVQRGGQRHALVQCGPGDSCGQHWDLLWTGAHGALPMDTDIDTGLGLRRHVVRHGNDARRLQRNGCPGSFHFGGSGRVLLAEGSAAQQSREGLPNAVPPIREPKQGVGEAQGGGERLGSQSVSAHPRTPPCRATFGDAQRPGWIDRRGQPPPF